MKHLFTLSFLSLACILSASAANVQVVMNSTSKTMSLVNKESNETIDVGEPSSYTYSFSASTGTYVLTAYATDGKTVNGTIELNVTDDAAQTFKVLTCTTYATNSSWVVDTDYTIDVKLTTNTGDTQVITLGNSTTSGRKTFLALNGNSYFLTMTPSAARQEEGYMTFYKTATLTASTTASGAIPMGADYVVTLPSDADFSLGMKLVHFTDFMNIEPQKTEISGSDKKITYRLASSQVYNYRTWKSGGLTQGGYFTMNTDSTMRPTLVFTNSDYEQFGAKTINHTASSNNGMETGDILVNINERGHLLMNIGETYDAHAMRSWETVDNVTNNYFIEPDFHYTVIDVNGNPSTGVIEIENANTTTSAWSTIKAVGKGTAIVLVTYDAIGLNLYSTSAVKSSFVGGEYWGAIWPENTAAYVVTVGETESTVVPNMTINVGYNNTGSSISKVADKYVDAEHDVFYFLDTEAGAYYTFTPEGVAKVEMAYPSIGEQMATYKGFASEGVTKNEDGSYTLLLKAGRQIVRLTDAAGNASYQVLTAKACHMEVLNASREGSKIFQPGDKIKVQYSGLFHPANKLAGIYNMSASAAYNSLPANVTCASTTNQYAFGSTDAAQAATITIPEDYDVEANPEIKIKDGAICVSGYGDPIGNHRLINRSAGRSANFTAISHKTYFGNLPSVSIQLVAVTKFIIKLSCDVEGADLTVSYNGKVLEADSLGHYEGTYGEYTVVGSKSGYRRFSNTYTIKDDAEGVQTFVINMTKASEGAWDGKSMVQPAVIDDVYQISSGAELAWYANDVNKTKNYTTKAILTSDIDLGDYVWTPIGGTTAATAYKGQFDGDSHTISGLYINNTTTNYQGLFGYVNAATISGLTVCGDVTGKQYVAGIAAYTNNGTVVDRCVNKAKVTSVNTSSYVGGIVGYVYSATSKVTNSYNEGTITGNSTCGGVVGYNYPTAIIENIYNVGEVNGTTYVGACVGGSSLKTNVKNIYALKEYSITTAHTLVTEEQMESGEVAYLLGEAFGQKIGTDKYPVLGGTKVLYDADNDKYYNDGATGIETTTADDVVAVEYYDIQGRRLSQPQVGINIVRMSDGSVKKVILK